MWSVSFPLGLCFVRLVASHPVFCLSYHCNPHVSLRFLFVLVTYVNDCVLWLISNVHERMWWYTKTLPQHLDMLPSLHHDDLTCPVYSRFPIVWTLPTNTLKGSNGLDASWSMLTGCERFRHLHPTCWYVAGSSDTSGQLFAALWKHYTLLTNFLQCCENIVHFEPTFCNIARTLYTSSQFFGMLQEHYTLPANIWQGWEYVLACLACNRPQAYHGIH